jgi:flagellar motility protein MotE (MotC chaperone)
MTNEKKKGSGLKTFLLAVVFPLVVVLMLALFFIGPLIGIDVIEGGKKWAAETPVLSSFVSDETEDSITETPNDLKSQNESLLVELEHTKSMLQETELTLSDTREQLESLETDQAELQQTNASEEAGQLTSDGSKDLAKTYELMSAKAAAAILNELSVEEIVVQLADVKPETKSAILAKMETEKAAALVREWSEALN